MRIVSLACSNTEIVAALGCAGMLVGVDDHSDYPPEALAGLPRLGPDLEIDIERVAALKPDLALASLTVPGQETVVEGLELADVPHIAPSPESMEDVYASVGEIAELLGVPRRGQEVVERMRVALAGTPNRDGPRILVEWWPKPVIAPGNKSWTHGVIEAAGGCNALGHEDRKSRPLDDVEVARLAPDAFVISWCGVEPAKYRPDVVLRNPAWRSLEAIRRSRVYTVPEAYLGRPGPRLVDGVAALRTIVGELAA